MPAIRYGTSFKDGKLYEFSADGILVLRQWPDLRAWRRTPKGRQWQYTRNGTWQISELKAAKNQEVMSATYKKVKSWLTDVTEQYAHKYTRD